MDGFAADPGGTDGDMRGWLAILGAWLAFGSFAVPMKWPAVVEAQVHPLVYQCYKTFWTFVTSHLVLLLPGFRYELSWWGILSGYSWVPAGVAAVVAVQHVGIARGQAIWQVTIIITSFIWGFFVLRDESVYNWWGTALSVIALTVGVVGMTLAFNLQRNLDTSEMEPPEVSMQPEPGLDAEAQAASTAGAEVKASARRATAPPPEKPVRKISSMGDLTRPEVGDALASEAENGEAQTAGSPRVRLRASTTSILFQRPGAASVFATFGASAFAGPYFLGRPKSRTSLSDLRFGAEDIFANIDSRASPRTTVLLRNPRHVSDAIGIGAALFNGVWGGANLVPSHYAPLSGIDFTLSFAWGALIANVTLVAAYALLSKLWWRTPLPSPHFKVMALPGFLSGSLWSAGNFCSLYVVDSMGQGIGYSLIQSSVIVSGIWGICYYREMSGRPIMFWVLWMFVCMAGVLGLAAEKA